MLRRVASISLFFSFLAVGISGVMMFVVARTSFTHQMHPPHKLFGMLMAVAGIFHIYYNWKTFLSYLKKKSGLVLSSVLFILLIILYAAGINKKVPSDLDAAVENSYKEMLN